jgi:acetylornithine/N-succinyldiaminopimelate aminotransferase
LFALVLRSHDAEALRDRAFERGLLINAPRSNVLRFMPSLRVSEEEIDSMIEVLVELTSDSAPAVLQAAQHAIQPA